MTKIREILRLHETAGMSSRQIARALAVSRPVVTRHVTEFNTSGLSWETVSELSDDELRAALAMKRKEKSPRYQELTTQFPSYVRELKKTGVTLKLLWEEYRIGRADVYSYAQFCCHFAEWRKDHQLSMHLEHKAGEKVFIDFAGDRLTTIDPQTGQEHRFEVFIAVLGGSGLMYVEPRLGQTTRDWIESLQNALHYFGGVPRIVVPDNARAVVRDFDKYEPGMTLMFDAFAHHYQLVVLPARIRRPKDKALAENGVRIVYQRVYAPLRTCGFGLLSELREAMWALMETSNRTPLQRLEHSRWELFEQVERVTLRPLPAQRFMLKAVEERKVQFNYHVELKLDRHYYSVPWQYRGKRAKLLYDDHAVGIYHDNVRIAHHLRDRTPGGYTTLPTHMPAQHRAYGDWNQDRLLSWARAVGEHTTELIKQVLASREQPEQAYKVCLGILNLVKRHGPVRLDAACRGALSFNTRSYRWLKTMLENHMEQEYQQELPWAETPLPDHENIRGSTYYT